MLCCALEPPAGESCSLALQAVQPSWLQHRSGCTAAAASHHSVCRRIIPLLQPQSHQRDKMMMLSCFRGLQHKASLAGPRAATPWSLQGHKEGCRHPGLITLLCQHSDDARREGMHRLQASSPAWQARCIVRPCLSNLIMMAGCCMDL